MASRKTIEAILVRLDEAGLTPQYAPPTGRGRWSWDALPPGIDPADGELKGPRLERKRRQIENFLDLLRDFIRPGCAVVDFGSSSGHVGMSVAHHFPKCRVVLLDKKPIPMRLAEGRIERSGLGNVRILCSDIRDFDEPFDIGLGLHVCGEATDFAAEKCFQRKAAYIFCPCDIGELKNSDLQYPRSAAFREAIDRDDYIRIARHADCTPWDFESEDYALGKRCSGYVSHDRNRRAEELGYETALYTLQPENATPKNDLISGRPMRS